jgi:hypothetical protein
MTTLAPRFSEIFAECELLHAGFARRRPSVRFMSTSDAIYRCCLIAGRASAIIMLAAMGSFVLAATAIDLWP